MSTPPSRSSVAVVARSEWVLKMRAFLDRAGQPFQIIRDHPVHAGIAHGLLAKLVRARRPPGAE